jgi:hypothetical protein
MLDVLQTGPCVCSHLSLGHPCPVQNELLCIQWNFDGFVGTYCSQPPDVVLYTMIKTFLVNDLLPSARRSNISGSVLSKQRAQERTVPLTKWL